MSPGVRNPDRSRNVADEVLRQDLDRHMEDLSRRVQEDDGKIEELKTEIKRLNREILSMKRSMVLALREREQIRTILRSLETRLLSINGKSSESDASPQD